MVKINKIYTRKGDDGSTGLVGGERVAKDSQRVDAYGELDELNSIVGLARTLAEKHERQRILTRLVRLQNEVFDLGSELASPPGSEWKGMIKATPEQAAKLERWIDDFNHQLPELKSFVLPGGTELNSALHMARTVCRRVERKVLALSRNEEVSRDILIYLNRLSDLFFSMARFESFEAGTPEYLWEPGKK